MRKTIFNIAVILAIGLSSYISPSYALSTSISNGITWLSGSQNTDGSWGAQADLELLCSTETLNVLISSGAGTNAAAANWLTSQNATSTDELSRTIISLVSAGTSSAALVTTLISNRNSDDGWGYELGNLSDPLDTALALQALKAVNYPDLSVDNTALAYLVLATSL